MKTKKILIIIGAMLFLLGILLFASPPPTGRHSIYSNTNDKTDSIIISVIGLGTLLTGFFWGKK